MRILILHSRYLSDMVSGENRMVDDQAVLLRDAGHEVRVWQPSPDVGSRRDVLRTGTGSIWSRHAAAEVRRLIGELRPHVIHCHNLFPSLSPLVLRTGSEAGIPTVVTLHNYRMLCLPATFVREGRTCEDCLGRLPWRGVVHRCYRGSTMGSGALAASLSVHRLLRTFSNVRLYIAVSRFTRDKHVEAGWPAERIRVRANFSWPMPQRTGPGDYFLYLGLLSVEKDVRVLIDLWRDVPARLVVAGDGPDAARLRAAAPPTVQFLGAVPPAEVPSLLVGARALLLPSRCYEGQPRSVIEAYSAGVPVIASRIGGIPEMVIDGVSGVLVPAAAPDAWTRAILSLLEDGESKRLGEQALAQWHGRYSPRQGLEGLEAVYREAVA